MKTNTNTTKTNYNKKQNKYARIPRTHRQDNLALEGEQPTHDEDRAWDQDLLDVTQPVLGEGAGNNSNDCDHGVCDDGYDDGNVYDDNGKNNNDKDWYIYNHYFDDDD